MRIGQTSILYLVCKVAASIIGFIAIIYFTRTLGEEVYGYYAVTLSLLSWFGIVKSAGFGGATVKKMSEGSESESYFAAGVITKTILLFLVIIFVHVSQHAINQYVGQHISNLLILLLLTSILGEIINTALKGTHRVYIYAPLNSIKEGIRYLIMILLVYIGLELTGMLLGYAIGTLLISTIGLYLFSPNFTIPERRHFRDLLDYAKFSWLGDMRKKTIRDVDILVLGLFVPAGLTGIYAVAYSLGKFLDIFGNAIQTTLFPELSKQSVSGNDEVIKSFTKDAIIFSGIFLIPSIIGALIIGDRVMLIYGSGFESGSPILVILLLGILFYSYNKQLLNTLNAIDRPDLSFRSNLIFITSNIILNVILVWNMGWYGAAIATVVSTFIGLAVSYRYAYRHISVEVPIREVTNQFFAAIVMATIVYSVRILAENTHKWSGESNTIFVFLLTLCGALVYIATLYIISSSFRSAISRNLPVTLPS